MPAQTDFDDIVAYLTRTTRLTPAEVRRIVHEIVNFMDETPDDFIRRRHRALQSAGCSNTEIFSRLMTELAQWRFRASEYSERQIRRVIYG